MKPNDDTPEPLESKPGAKSAAKHDWKTLPMPELEKQLASSPDGLSQAEAEKRLAQYGSNELAIRSGNRNKATGYITLCHLFTRRANGPHTIETRV